MLFVLSLSFLSVALSVTQEAACTCKDEWGQHGYRDDHSCSNSDTAWVDADCAGRAHEEDGHNQEDCEVDTECTFGLGAELCLAAKKCGGSECAAHDEGWDWCEVVDPVVCEDSEAWGRCGGATPETSLPDGCECMDTWQSEDCDIIVDTPSLAENQCTKAGADVVVDGDNETWTEQACTDAGGDTFIARHMWQGCPAEPCDVKTNNEVHSWCNIKKSADCPLWVDDDEVHHGGHFVDCSWVDAPELTQEEACECKDTWGQHGYRDDHTCSKSGNWVNAVCDDREHVEDGHNQEDCEVDNECTFGLGAELCLEAEKCGGAECAAHDEGWDWCEVVDPVVCEDSEAWGRCGGTTPETSLPDGCECMETWQSEDCDLIVDTPSLESNDCTVALDGEKDTWTEDACTTAGGDFTAAASWAGCPAEPCDVKTNNEVHRWCNIKKSADCSLWVDDDEVHHGGHFVDCGEDEDEGAGEGGSGTGESGTSAQPSVQSELEECEAELKASTDPCECKCEWGQHGYRDDHTCTKSDNWVNAVCDDREHVEDGHNQEDCEVDDECTFALGPELCLAAEKCGGVECASHDEGWDWCEVVDPVACPDSEAWGRCGGDTDFVNKTDMNDGISQAEYYALSSDDKANYTDTKLPAGCECMETWQSEDCDLIVDTPSLESNQCTVALDGEKDTWTADACTKAGGEFTAAASWSGCPAKPCDVKTNNEVYSWCVIKKDANCPLWVDDDDVHHGGHWVDCGEDDEAGEGDTGDDVVAPGGGHWVKADGVKLTDEEIEAAIESGKLSEEDAEKVRSGKMKPPGYDSELVWKASTPEKSPSAALSATAVLVTLAMFSL